MLSVSLEAELTINLKGKFLGLAVVTVLLQVAYGEFLEGKSSLPTKQQNLFYLHTKNSLCNISPLLLCHI